MTIQETPSLGPSNDEIPEWELRQANVLARVGLRNQRFAKLSPARKRVAVARDVLKWLATGKLTASRGQYLRSIVGSDNDYTVDGGTCTACAMGGLFACTIERTGWARPIVDMRRSTSVFRREARDSGLGGVFDIEQLLDIEAAFEGTAEYGGSYAAAAWGRQAGVLSHDVMVAIMQNIIRNNGTFVFTGPGAHVPTTQPAGA